MILPIYVLLIAFIVLNCLLCECSWKPLLEASLAWKDPLAPTQVQV